MKRIVLHIGTHRTGTTSIQTVLSSLVRVTRLIFVAYHRLRALHSEKHGNYHSARNDWRTCIKMQSNKPKIESLTGLARCLQNSGDYEEADKIYNQLNSQYPAFKKAYALRAINLGEACKHDEALQYWNKCADVGKNPTNIEWLLKRAKTHMLLNNYNEAEDQYLNIYGLYPDRIDVIEALCELYNIKQDWASLLRFSKILVEKDMRTKHKPHWDLLYARSLVGLHRIDQAKEYFLSIIDSYEHKPVIIGKMVEMATILKFVDRLEYNWEELLKIYPDNTALHNAYINYLIILGDYGHLKTYSESVVKNASLYLPLFNCYMAMYRFKEARDCLQKSHLADHDPLHYHMKLANNYMRCWDNTGLQEVLQNLLHQGTSHHYSEQLKILLIRIYIRLNDINEAVSRIEQLDPWLAGREDVSVLMAWRENIFGHHDHSKDICINLLKTHYFLSMHSPISITRLDKRKMIHRDDDILLFSPMKNCIDSLPWFLDYYRQLGVNYFYIIDNDSDDAMAEYLLNQPDVHLFYSKDSYAHNKSGMRWINYLISEYAGNAWCIFVDIDEALVFPGMEGSSLRNLLDYMDKQGHEVLPAFMLDMYPTDMKTLRSCHNTSERIKISEYFDNDYRFFNTTLCPYRAVKGGIRKRLFGTREILEKAPIVKGGRGISYLISHGVTSAICSDITAVLLHYNIPFNPQLFDSKWEPGEDVQIQSRMGWCKLRYGVYGDVISARELGYSYLNKKSVRYESPQQLVELGLMNVPDTYVY